ncbi:unnamed protein product [Closterium sp. NIES-53]
MPLLNFPLLPLPHTPLLPSPLLLSSPHHHRPEPGSKADDTAAPIMSGYNTKHNEFDPEYDNEAEAPLAEPASPLSLSPPVLALTRHHRPEPGTKTDDAATPITSGYNTKRNEFDPEYDNEAEAPLAELEFKDSDSSVDRQLKIKMLHIYYSRTCVAGWRHRWQAELEAIAHIASSAPRSPSLCQVGEWSRRKAFILERDLLDPRRAITYKASPFPSMERDLLDPRRAITYKASPFPSISASPLQAGRVVPAQGIYPGTWPSRPEKSGWNRVECKARRTTFTTLHPLFTRFPLRFRLEERSLQKAFILQRGLLDPRRAVAYKASPSLPLFCVLGSKSGPGASPSSWSVTF